MIPIAELVFHFTPTGLTWDQSVRSPQVVALNGDDLTDLAVVNPFDRLAASEVIAIGKSRQDTRSVFLGKFVCSEDLLDTGHIHGRRFFHKHVFLGLDGGQRIRRVKTRCARNEYDVTVLDHIAIPIESGKTSFRRNLNAVTKNRGQIGHPRVDLVGKRIGHGPQLCVRVGRQRVGSGTLSTPTTANESQLDRIAARRMGTPTDRQRHRGRGSPETRLADNLATGTTRRRGLIGAGGHGVGSWQCKGGNESRATGAQTRPSV